MNTQIRYTVHVHKRQKKWSPHTATEDPSYLSSPCVNTVLRGFTIHTCQPLSAFPLHSCLLFLETCCVVSV